MLLGKRLRPPIKRTTSMTGITVDVSNMEPSSDHHHHDFHVPHQNHPHPHATSHHHHETGLSTNGTTTNCDDDHQGFLEAAVSPRIRTRNASNDLIETAHFLRICGLCQRRLAPGRDIYMYRGDTAFCSLECREQQMKQDERKEKLSGGHVGSKKKDDASSKTAAASAGKNETVAAA